MTDKHKNRHDGNQNGDDTDQPMKVSLHRKCLGTDFSTDTASG